MSAVGWLLIQAAPKINLFHVLEPSGGKKVQTPHSRKLPQSLKRELRPSREKKNEKKNLSLHYIEVRIEEISMWRFNINSRSRASVSSTLCEPSKCWRESSASSFSSSLLFHLKERMKKKNFSLSGSSCCWNWKQTRKGSRSPLVLRFESTQMTEEVRPGSRTGGGTVAASLSSCNRAFSMAWLKEFWKLGTGTRSDPSLSPSLSAAGGASSLSATHAQSWTSPSGNKLRTLIKD